MSDAELSVLETVEMFCGRWLKISNRSKKTITAYETDLRQFVEMSAPGWPLADLNRYDVERWVLHLQDAECQPSTIRRKLASLRAFFTYAVETHLLARSPMCDLRVRLSECIRLTRVVPGDGILQILDCLQEKLPKKHGSSKRDAIAHRDYAIVRLLGATGVRVGELCTLQCSDVIENGTCMRILGKGARERLALLVDDEDRNSLGNYQSLRTLLNPTTNQLFVNVHGTALSTEGVRLILRQAAQAAGITGHITPHMLRHTAATKLLEHGADIRVIQSYLGHRSIRSTERYTHVSTGHLRSVISRCHPLRSAA